MTAMSAEETVNTVMDERFNTLSQMFKTAFPRLSEELKLSQSVSILFGGPGVMFSYKGRRVQAFPVGGFEDGWQVFASNITLALLLNKDVVVSNDEELATYLYKECH